MAHKTAEIADSDGESDAGIAPSACLAQSHPSPRQNQAQAVPDIDLGVNFSDFLSQSQKGGVHDVQPSEPQIEQSEGDERSTGTTASLRRQIESEQRKLAEQKSSENARLSRVKFSADSRSSDSPLVAKTKRSHSELLSGCQMDGRGDLKRKRRKTYSSSSTRLRSSQSDLFAEEYQNQEEGNVADHLSGKGSEGSSDASREKDVLGSHQADFFGDGIPLQTKGYSDPSDGPSILHQGVVQPQEQQQQRQLDNSVRSDASKDCMQMSSGHISTSRSLMGNHESINLHFSGSGPGLDVDANPFGSASQGSVEAENCQTDQEKLRAIFRPSASPAGNTSALPFSQSLDSRTPGSFVPEHSNLDEATYPPKLSSSRLASTRSKSCVNPSVLTRNPLSDIQGDLASERSSSRKRRKTADSFAVDALFPGLNDKGLQSLAAPTDPPTPKVEVQGKKRGRKPKHQVTESGDALQPEQPEKQRDKKFPSCDEGEMEKNSSSERYSDDEPAIGLPQEQYKPRPSRSRSKRTAQDEMPPPAHTPMKAVQSPLKQAQTPDAMNTGQLTEPEEDTPLTKLRKEKKRKNKMKRAKTSAGTLLKKSDKMHSDGEEDVMWVESKPATVKMKLPDPVEVKREDTGRHKQRIAIKDEGKLGDTTASATREQSTEEDREKAVEVSIDIPRGEQEPQKPPPKKRGRKKKTAVEKAAPTENEESIAETANAASGGCDDAEAENEDLSNDSGLKASSRQVLREKDVNTSYSSAPQSIEQVVSTPQKKNTLQETSGHITDSLKSSPTTELPEKQQQQQQPPTPQPKSSTTTDSTDKGPTKHSPINPTGGKVKYRVGLSKRAAIPPLLKMVRK